MPSPSAPRRHSPRDIAGSGLCIGCGSCVAQARSPSVQMRFDRYGQLKPDGPKAWLSERSSTFSSTCPFSPAARNEDELAREHFPQAAHCDEHIGRFQAAYVGHVEDEDFRQAGSSGGMVTWTATELLRQGLVDAVAHVSASADPEPGQSLFGYRISRSEGEVRAAAKSRYYPIELSAVLREIRDTPGRYAVVGVPCFIKAVRLLCGEDPVLRERVAFTLGLFCGHMKSARLVESFAWQMDARIGEVGQVEFRLKDPHRPANWYTAELRLRGGDVRRKDWWGLADGDWGSGYFQNSACNFCDDVVGETADISFGDAWVEPYSSDGRGTNVVVVRSPVLHGLVQAAIRDGRLNLQEVDAGFVVETQAAGFRQRREGLAYRLSWPRLGVRRRKRVAPATTIPWRRKLIYLARQQISAWSHRMFLVARLSGRPQVYVGWARRTLGLYHGLAYSRGRLGMLADRLEGARHDR